MSHSDSFVTFTLSNNLPQIPKVFIDAKADVIGCPAVETKTFFSYSKYGRLFLISHVVLNVSHFVHDYIKVLQGAFSANNHSWEENEKKLGTFFISHFKTHHCSNTYRKSSNENIFAAVP